jgi:chromosomal replication initiator protein
VVRLAAPVERGVGPTPAGLRRLMLRLASAVQHGGQHVGPQTIDRLLAAQRPESASVARCISAAVARHFGITAGQLKGKSREQTIARARCLAMYLCRQHTDLTFAQIGRLFGRRDHSTVLHACRKAADLAAGDPLAIQALTELSAALTTNFEVQAEGDVENTSQPVAKH